jgi:death-on-curing protein
MKTPVWVLKDTVLALHEQLIAEFGGAPGLRDNGLLESALARPEQRWAFDKPTLFALSASYAFGLAKNHPFVDGNKRIALTVAVLFLELNGLRVQASEPDAVIKTLGLAAGAIGEAEYALWLKTHSRRARPE